MRKYKLSTNKNTSILTRFIYKIKTYELFIVRKLYSNGAFVVVICEKTLQYFRSLINCIDILSYIIKNVYSKIEIYKILFIFR